MCLILTLTRISDKSVEERSMLLSERIYIKINFFYFLTIYFLIYRCSLTFFVKKYISYVSNNY